MAIDGWFRDWADRHVERFPRSDWPGADGEYWQELRHLMVRNGTIEPVADEASRAMFLTPPDFVSDHPGRLEVEIRRIHRERQARATKPASKPADVHGEEFNRQANAHWATIDEGERAEWRALARERIPFFRGLTNELLAIAWAYDPASVISPPPKEATPNQRGPKRLFSDPNVKKVD